MRGQWHGTTDKVFRHWQSGGTGSITNLSIAEFRHNDNEDVEDMYHFAPAYWFEGVTSKTRLPLASMHKDTYEMTAKDTSDVEHTFPLDVYTVYSRKELRPHIADATMGVSDKGVTVRFPHNIIDSKHPVEQAYVGPVERQYSTINGVKFKTIIPVVSTYFFMAHVPKGLKIKPAGFAAGTKEIIQKYNTGPIHNRYKLADGTKVWQRQFKKSYGLWSIAQGGVGTVQTTSLTANATPGGGVWKNAGTCPIAVAGGFYQCGVVLDGAQNAIYRVGYYPEGLDGTYKLKLVQPMLVDSRLLSAVLNAMQQQFGASRGPGTGLYMYSLNDFGEEDKGASADEVRCYNSFSVINDLHFEETEWT